MQILRIVYAVLLLAKLAERLDTPDTAEDTQSVQISYIKSLASFILISRPIYQLTSPA